MAVFVATLGVNIRDASATSFSVDVATSDGRQCVGGAGWKSGRWQMAYDSMAPTSSECRVFVTAFLSSAESYLVARLGSRVVVVFARDGRIRGGANGILEMTRSSLFAPRAGPVRSP